MGKEGRHQRIENGLRLLLDAYDYAADCETSVWDFAVESAQLRTLELNENEFRWLILKGYVEHQVETTLPGDEKRSFHPIHSLRFPRKSCFVLTPAGLEYAQSLAKATDCRGRVVRMTESGNCDDDPTSDELPQDARPFWDGERHELWFGMYLVKHFKKFAQNQETILSAFQEEGWPPRIDDPLAPENEIEAKRRLNDTIKSLNRHHRVHLLHFAGDGTAEGIIWERVDEKGCPVWQYPSPNGP